MDFDGKAEVGWQVAADFGPLITLIVCAEHVPVLLHIESVRARRMHRDAVNTVADFSFRVGNVLRAEASVDRHPAFAGVFRAKCAGGRNGDEDAVGIVRVEQDGMKAHATGAGRPFWARAMSAE